MNGPQDGDEELSADQLYGILRAIERQRYIDTIIGVVVVLVCVALGIVIALWID